MVHSVGVDAASCMVGQVAEMTSSSDDACNRRLHVHLSCACCCGQGPALALRSGIRALRALGQSNWRWLKLRGSGIKTPVARRFAQGYRKAGRFPPSPPVTHAHRQWQCIPNGPCKAATQRQRPSSLREQHQAQHPDCCCVAVSVQGMPQTWPWVKH
jgi:hypothetical protein